MINPSAVQNETSCPPSPCGRLSRPRTTTKAPPPVRLICETGTGESRCRCAITLLGQASLVPLLTLKHPRLGVDARAPDSGLLLLRNIVGSLGRPGESHARYRSAGCSPFEKAFSRSKPFPIPGSHPRTTPVLTGMGVKLPEGVRRFLSVTMRGLYLAGRTRRRGFACVPRCRKSSFADGLTRFRQLTS